MLPLLQKKLSRKQQLELQVIGFVVVLHLVAFFLFFFTGHHDTFNKAITLHATQREGMKVVFLPLYTSMPTTTTAVKAASALVQPVQPSQEAAKKKAPAKPAPKAVAKQVQAPPKKPATQITKAPPRPSAKPEPKKEAPAQAKKVTPVAAQQPVQPSKVESAASPKAEVAPKAVAAQKIVEPEAASIEAELPSSIALGAEDILYVGQHERALLQVQEHLQAELARCWKAPTTMKGNPSCDLLVKIDRGGKASSVNIVKTSGAKLYDMLAQKAFRVITYPRQLWGKEITFTFKGQ